ncbi:MAG: hypothetical protein Q7T28_00145 [Cypionkella sp.]|nr:hypothetical protein [Cypionkella sp.]
MQLRYPARSFRDLAVLLSGPQTARATPNGTNPPEPKGFVNNPARSVQTANKAETKLNFRLIPR